ncbi:MAG: radical SAM protein, partial [Desulfobacteraceae bacterium]
GGVHVSSLPEEASLYADTIFIGEAEETWPKFIEDYKNNRPKVIYKCERYPDLQQLSIPRWDLVKSKYPVTYVQTTRGCPHRCEFCLVKSYLGRPRFKPLENVLKEIETVIGRTKSNLIDFADDNIFSNKKYSRALFEALIPLNVNWWGAASIDVAKDEEILTLARKSGCVSLGIGIESINQKSLDSVNKGRQNKTLKLKENIRKIQSHGISVLGLFMLGFDEDDPTIFQRTRDFIEEANLGICSFSILTPLPGTSIFDKLRKEGRLIHQNWDLYNYFNVNYEPKLMSREELREGFNRVVNSLYSYNHLFARLDREWQAIKGSYSNHENDREIAARVHMIKKYYVDMLLDEYDSLKSEATMRPYLKRVIHEIQNKDVSVIPVLSSGLTQTYQYSQMVEDNGKGQWQEVYHEN